MINFDEARAYFRDTIIASGIFAPDAIDWDNYVRPSDVPYPDLWMRESRLNVDEGKSDSVYGDYTEDILSFSINVPIGSFTSVVNTAAVALGNLFPAATIANTANYKISIKKSKTAFQGKLPNDSKWYNHTVDVYIVTYEQH